jgi:hypothetical protein
MALSKITTRALANDSVTADKVADNAITTDMVASGEIGVTDLADGSITNAKVSSTAAIAASKVDLSSIAGNVDLASGALQIGGNTVINSSRQAFFTAATGSSLKLERSDVGHGMTAIAETATFGHLTAEGGANGGLRITALADTASTSAFNVSAYAHTPSTDGNAAVIRLRGSKKNGTGEQAIADSEDLLSIGNVGTERIIVKGNGDFQVNGTTVINSSQVGFLNEKTRIGTGATYPTDNAQLYIQRSNNNPYIGFFSNDGSRNAYLQSNGSGAFYLNNAEGGGWAFNNSTSDVLSISNSGTLTTPTLITGAYGAGGSSGDGFRLNSTDLYGQINATDKVRIAVNGNSFLNGGNVGIGDTGPTSVLSIQKNSTRTTDFENMLKITHTSSGTTGVGFGSAIYFVGERNNGVNQAMGRLVFDAEVNSGTNISSGFSVQTATNGSTSEKLRVTHDGNVGIGSQNPVAPLVISNGGASGIEFHPEIANNYNRMTNYNRSSNSYNQLGIDASQIDIRPSGVRRFSVTTAGAIVNPDARADADFRVVSDSNSYMLFVDSSANKVSIGSQSYNYGSALTIHDNTAGSAPTSLFLRNSGTSSGSGATIQFGYTSGYGAQIRFSGNPSSYRMASTTFATVTGDGTTQDNVQISTTGDTIVYNDLGVGHAGNPDHVLDVEASVSGDWISQIYNTHNSNGYGLKVRAGDDGNVTSFRVSNYDNSKTLLNVYGDGSVSMPNTPAFHGKRNSTLSNPAANTVHNLSFVTERFDLQNNFNGTLFTAPVTGKYYLAVNLRLEQLQTNATYYQVYITTSNEAYQITLDPNFSANLNFYGVAYSVLADMDGGDTAKIQWYQVGGSTGTDIHSSSYFCGHLVA